MQDSMIAKFEESKGKLIMEIFIDTGDEDYVAARWLFLNHLARQFFWNAAQALEKYLKAVLLTHGCPVKDYSHNIVSLFKEVKRYDGGVIPDNLTPPEQVKLFSDTDLWGDSSTERFVRHICENGDPSNRYDYFGIEQDFGDLYNI